MPVNEQWYQYEVIELQRNLLLNAYAETIASSERTARRRCHKEWPADEYRLHLIGYGPVETEADGK